MTIVALWICIQLGAPWWCYAIIMARLILKILWLGAKEQPKGGDRDAL